MNSTYTSAPDSIWTFLDREQTLIQLPLQTETAPLTWPYLANASERIVMTIRSAAQLFMVTLGEAQVPCWECCPGGLPGGTQDRVSGGQPDMFFAHCTGGFRFIRICLNRNWPLSQVFSKLHLNPCCVMLHAQSKIHLIWWIFTRVCSD